MERGRGGFERWRRRGRVWGTIEIGGGAFSGCGRRGFGFERFEGNSGGRRSVGAIGERLSAR